MSGFNIKILNFAKDQEKPFFKESRNGLWIEYGDNNLYPQYLLDVYHNKSNKHKAIINKKVMMTTGNGIEALTPELQAFMKNQWADYDLEELAVKINYDLEIYGGFSLQVRWNIDGTKVVALDYIPFQKVRLSTDYTKVLISKDWNYIRKPDNKPTEYIKFNPKMAVKHPTQIFYYLTDTVGQEYYPIPYYSSTLNWIELDWEISNFHLSSVRNGFMPGFILNFATGIPTAEEMEMAYREFERKYTGSENAGKFILTFSEGADGKPELMPIPLNDSDERFIMLHKEMKEEIFVGHSVTSPMLFGIRTEGQLGGKDEMLEALAIFQSTYIRYKQELISKQLNKIATWAGVTEEIKFNKYSIDFGTIEDGGTTPVEPATEEENNQL
jgi:hypothetical protein